MKSHDILHGCLIFTWCAKPFGEVGLPMYSYNRKNASDVD